MAPDKKTIYILSAAALAVLLLAFFAPVGLGRPLAAVLLLPTAAVTCLFIKKRTALSLYSGTVFLLMAAIGALYLMGYYVSGLFVGFTKTGYGLHADILLTYTLPIGIIIVCTELIRYVLCAQKDKVATVFSYAICLLGDVIIFSTLSGVRIFVNFMDMVGLTLFPGLLYNALYNYLSSRYGWKPNLVFRFLTTWAFYLIPYGSAISYSLLAFINMMMPIGIYYFIDSLFEKKRRYAQKNRSRFSRTASYILTVLAIVMMLGTVMLISNHFYYGAYVIATESMTGELNKGDIAISERYEDQLIQEGQVIAFKKSKSVIIHRVVDIQVINGETRYTTKGDANEDVDVGYVVDSQIVGLVDLKIPYLGYPTLGLRSLFEH